MTDFTMKLLDLILMPFKTSSVIFLVPASFCCVVGAFALVKRMMYK